MQKWVLGGILLLGFLLRVVLIDKYPVGFTADEASFGYDAYSLLKTGKDQWGNYFPLVLKSFGDYKAPLYGYLAVPSVALFGLDKFAVRLPNAILGTMAILVIWLLVAKLFDKKTALISATLLAVSPWNVALSRGAFEANMITFFLPLGIYLFLTKKYFWSGVIFGLNLFTYHSAKLITPLVFLALIFYNKENIKKIYPAVITFGILFVLTVYTFTTGAGTRVSERSVMVGAVEVGAQAKIELIQKGINPTLAKILHNKYQVAAERFFRNYIQYFSLRFLVYDGAGETNYGMVRNLGVLSYAEIAGIIALVFFIGKFKDRRLLLFLLFWLLIAPVPSALATGVGYTGNRAAGMIPVFQIFAGFGLAKLVERYKQAKYLVVLIILAGLGVFLYRYLVLSPKISAKGMLAGSLETASEIVKNSDKYDEIVVSKSLSEPQIFIAFASKYDPRQYQKATRRWRFEDMGIIWLDQMPEYSLGKYTFK